MFICRFLFFSLLTAESIFCPFIPFFWVSQFDFIKAVRRVFQTSVVNNREHFYSEWKQAWTLRGRSCQHFQLVFFSLPSVTHTFSWACLCCVSVLDERWPLNWTLHWEVVHLLPLQRILSDFPPPPPASKISLIVINASPVSPCKYTLPDRGPMTTSPLPITCIRYLDFCPMSYFCSGTKGTPTTPWRKGSGGKERESFQRQKKNASSSAKQGQWNLIYKVENLGHSGTFRFAVDRSTVGANPNRLQNRCETPEAQVFTDLIPNIRTLTDTVETDRRCRDYYYRDRRRMPKKVVKWKSIGPEVCSLRKSH